MVLSFNNVNQFYNHLEKKNKTVLITSTTYFQTLSQDQSLKDKEIISFFIYQDNQTQIDVEYKSNLKIEMISSSFDDISKKLTEYLNSIINKFLRENVSYKAGHRFDCKEECIKYFYNQVIFNLFKSNKLSDQQSKTAFIDFCQKNYINLGGRDDDLEEIIETVNRNEFKKNNIILWYTTESFFYKLLNGVLRKDDICEFFKIRYAINQLSDALIDYEYISKSDFSVYRASLIDKAELSLFQEKAIGGNYIIQLTGFLSTTSNEDIVINKFGIDNNFYKNKDNQYSIMYKIKIDHNECNKIYDIKSVSAIPSEDEILLNYDTFIRIESVEKSDIEQFDFIVNCSIANFKEIQNQIDLKTQEITSHFNLNDYKYSQDDFYLISLLNNLRKDNECLRILNNINTSDQKEQSINIYKAQNHFYLFLKELRFN